MTKKDYIKQVAGVLERTGEEIPVTNFPELRQPNRGLHAYCIRYDKMSGRALVYP